MANPNPSNTNALNMLLNDHRKVEKLFSEFEELPEKDTAKKKKLADSIGADLIKHMVVEEEIFYPTVQESIKDSEDLVKEAIVEHAAAKNLIKQLQAMNGTEDFFDSKVKVLKEQIEHHIEEEESEMFPKVRKSSMNLEKLGEAMAARKEKL